MQQILNFVIKNKTFLLFLLLFSIALGLTIQSHSYHRSKFINSANALTGGVYGTVNSVDQYFHLKTENELLAEENKRLREQLLIREASLDSSFVDTTYAEGRYKITIAQVFKNSYSLPNNYLTLNKGKNDSIKQDFGVINSNGIIGIIDNTSKNYSTVLSILNRRSRINAKIKSSNHIGSLTWNGESPIYVQLEDVSQFAPIKVGDTIQTGGESTIFPKGIGIGTIDSFETDISGDTYIIEVKLFNDMTNLGTVYILENLDRAEILSLENDGNE
ncbi:rod shape-determining protein MreC [Winogradskyella epiphytica]|uniref:Cell shape-determining protein MreC n=1 Tax=Winogradskyella epiphytica TaxID=262005 RepID=A0A2V4XKL0_9FLAO|nr:rod shape-determining protein MreC [Winogradskyella epiphytica]PYE82609.1 rod shape-determining protein MreC [Winogradskyella epiphytica]GGW72220.1 rod shape-determining protein MreC [Winogradskyella epiphytica]